MIADPPNGAGLGLVGATEALINRLRMTETNEEFMDTLERG